MGRWENSASGFQDATYTRDAVGNVTTITDNVTATATKECFLYDSRNRLVRAHTASSGSTCVDPATPTAGGRVLKHERGHVWQGEQLGSDY